MARVSFLALCISLWASPAFAQTTADAAPVPPPSGASELAAPMPEAPPPPPGAAAPQTAPPATGYVQPAVGYQQPGAAYAGQPYAGQPYAGQPYAGQPVVGQPVVAQPVTGFAPPPHRGDRLEDTAATGEIVDLMITTGGYGVLLGNSIVDWAPDGTSGVASHFTATVLGVALSLTGLLAIDAPRGVPTTMAIGLRYGVVLGAFGYGAFAGNNFQVEPFLASMVLGGLVGYGVGAGVGFGTRPHASRSRFVEAGGLWGAGFAGLLAGAVCNRGGCDGSAAFGALLAGVSAGVATHIIIAALNPVHAGRGWLMNAGFAVGAGLGAFFTWGLSNGTAGGEYVMGIAAGVGFAGLVTLFAITDGIQDSGWDEGTEEVLSRIQISAGPTQGGAVGTISGQF